MLWRSSNPWEISCPVVAAIEQTMERPVALCKSELVVGHPQRRTRARPKPLDLSVRNLVRGAQRHRAILAELLDEVAAHARMHAPLPVVEHHGRRERQSRRVPDPGMEVEALAAVAIEADEFLRREVIARQRQRHDEWAALLREEELAA